MTIKKIDMPYLHISKQEKYFFIGSSKFYKFCIIIDILKGTKLLSFF